MKTIYSFLILVVATLGFSSCNSEWEDEQYEHFVSFKAPLGSNGVTNIYVRYNEGGKVTYKLPVIVSGSTKHSEDINVHIAVDSDTLKTLNEERFSSRTDVYYKELTNNYYNFAETLQVPGGQDVALLDVNFTLEGIDMVDKWVLPLTIAKDPSYGYEAHPRKNYAKALLRVIPFNDYSGSYSTTTMEVYSMNDKGENIGDAIVTNNRTGFVVDNKTIFFYAGLTDEDLKQRALYKIYATFNDDKTMTFTADDPSINFKMEKVPSYSITETMDATRPYLLHRYVSFTVEYTFDDITSTKEPLHYRVKGTMTLERNINTQIPDEDQAIEW